MEEWRTIEGFPDYQVSNLGRVKSLKWGKTVILKQSLNTTGYFTVELWDNNCRKAKKIHRFVAKAFLPNPNGFEQVDHIDRVRTNNSVSNLRWASSSLQMVNRDMRLSQSGHKHIYNRNGKYRVIINRNNKCVLRKSFKSLEEAIRTRDEFLATEIII